MKSVIEFLAPDVWLTVLDLKDACFHILIHQFHRKCLQLRLGSKVFQYASFPFGLAIAPDHSSSVYSCSGGASPNLDSVS